MNGNAMSRLLDLCEILAHHVRQLGIGGNDDYEIRLAVSEAQDAVKAACAAEAAARAESWPPPAADGRATWT